MSVTVEVFSNLRCPPPRIFRASALLRGSYSYLHETPRSLGPARTVKGTPRVTRLAIFVHVKHTNVASYLWCG